MSGSRRVGEDVTTVQWGELGPAELRYRPMVFGYTNYPERLANVRVTRISKAALLEAVTANRANHLAMATAMEQGYRAKLVEELARMLADAKEGKPVKHTVPLVEPMHNLKDYDRALRQLQLEVRDEVELTDEEFANYVMDEWRWSRDVRAVALNYADPGEAIADANGLTRTSWSPKA